MRRMLLTPLIVMGLTLLLAGCAKGPSGMTNGTNTGEQLFVTMKVNGAVDLSDDYYFVCFNYATGPGVGTPWTRGAYQGPSPVVTDFESGGNGFAGGAFTTYVEIHQNQAGGTDFDIYPVTSSLGIIAAPYGQATNGSYNGNTISFQIPLSAIAACSSETTATTVTTSEITALEVNFITTNNISPNPNDTSPKNFDALGDPLSLVTSNTSQSVSWVTIPTGQDTTYSGTDGTGDVATFSSGAYTTDPALTNFTSSLSVLPNQSDPAVASLDITNWSISFSG